MDMISSSPLSRGSIKEIARDEHPNMGHKRVLFDFGPDSDIADEVLHFECEAFHVGNDC